MIESKVKRSRFSELLMRNHVADGHSFHEWIFLPGMLFNAREKWWGEGGRRGRPHEGLDLCLFRNRQGRVVRLEEGTAVPAMYDGVVVKIMDDFLGKSLIIDHGVSGKKAFCSIFGHTAPRQGLEPGDAVREGEVIGAIAGIARPKTGLIPHLHITTGLLRGNTSYEGIDWETIDNPDIITLLDPLGVIGGNYVIENIVIPF